MSSSIRKKKIRRRSSPSPSECPCAVSSTPSLIYQLSSFLLSLTIFCLSVYLFFRSVVYAREWYDSRDPKLAEIRLHLARIHPRGATVELYRGNKSYTINKKKIYLCLYDESRHYYPMNMLMYVAIHELAHCLCDEIGHTASFFTKFKELLEKAEAIGVYDPDTPPIDNYCMSVEDDTDPDTE